MPSCFLVGRRTLLHWCGLAALVGGAPARATLVAAPQAWGDPALEGQVILPQRNKGAMRRIDPPRTAPSARNRQAMPGRPFAPEPPTAYVVTAEHAGVPAWVLYGVALQESKLKLGDATVPYPWTLGVRGRGERYGSFHAAKAALERHLQAGVRNIDCGAMQINWHWHSDKLAHPARALHPYANLAIGAAILQRHFMATGSWDEAVGLYHTGSVRTADQRGRSVRYRASVARGLNALGVSMQAAVQGHVLAGQRRRDA